MYSAFVCVYPYCVESEAPPTLTLIGASVSEPLSIDLNVNFVWLSVCLSWMDHQLTVNLALILRVLRHALIQKPLES